MTEQEALAVCKDKIALHNLDMKLVSCTVDENENKTTFYFTADGRIDFRELVKDLASVFHNRIELRQIGVRDEAKMIGGIGICGRPYCCKEFLDDFAPVSTKMAKVQSLSLNPAKISGSCGRLMCCLRYEEDAYEELVKTVPKQGAYVETPDGFGTAVSVDLLRQTVKVRLDSDSDDTARQYKACQVAAVPGGRPKDGEKPAHVLHYNPADDVEEPKEDEEDPWSTPEMFAESADSSSDGRTDEADSDEPDQDKKNSKKPHKGAHEKSSGDKKKHKFNRKRFKKPANKEKKA